ncbi:50S ribosomal protein L17 [bacterium]|nr:50S ribosomal protein L17 [bacterium]
MRHQKKGFKLGRTSSHRKATLQALSNALIRHKRITTTITKAKALRMFVEPIINRAKEDSTLNRRQAFRYLQDKESIKALFGDIAGKIGDRPGGYTRIVKLGQRAGDSTEMAIIELVDFNDVRPDGSSSGSAKKTRRAGRRKKTSDAVAAPASVATVVEEAIVSEAEAVAEEVAEVVAEVEAVSEEIAEAVTEEVKAVDAPAEEAEATAEDASAADEATDESDDKKEA